MVNSQQEKYLGDIIHKSGMLRHTVEARVAKGYGAISTILAILSEIPLGSWRIQAGLQLRQALLLNSILFNSPKVITKSTLKISLEALYLETGSIPIKFIIKNRRLNYLYTIVNKENDELVKDIYEAQKISPMEGDFCKLIEADKNEINLQITETEISQLKECKYKSIVKNKIKEAAFKNLLEIKNNHSKMKNLVYQKHELQPYLSSPLFGNEDIEMLLALRTRTVRESKVILEACIKMKSAP